MSTAGLRAAAVMLLRAAEANRRAVAALAACECAHGEGSHDIRRDGTRGACSVHTGPKGTPCGCLQWSPLLPPE